MSPVSFCAGSRFAHYTGGVFLSFYDWYCDLPPGEPLTWGVQTEACECADWFNAKYIILWGSNISQTRIPEAHFAYEARYNGAKIVCISPDYNSSSIHADLYFRINPGTDGILALGVAQKTIQLWGVDPALEGSYRIQLADGKTVEVTTVFELLKQELSKYPLDKV